VALAATAVLASAPAGAQTAQQPAASINAEGNVFTGGLQFNPATAAVKVGDTVRWTNTDALVPHTATEDHGLWNLTGTYGQTPANPPGFGPGETRERRFAAGTWTYFCEVHPVQMHGTISVPVELSVRAGGGRKHHKKKHRSATAAKRHRKRGKAFKILAVWAAEALPRGQVFDVQARRGPGDWRTVMDGTTDLQGIFPAGPRGTSWTYRARVRADDNRNRASGYSPEATITVG
jgi:plastocyanin